MEQFGMETDFEDGQEIDYEFCNKKRKTKKLQTREDVLYGVFVNSDDDDDEGASSSRKRKKGLKSKADIMKPVYFLSSGTVGHKNEDDSNKPGLDDLLLLPSEFAEAAEKRREKPKLKKRCVATFEKHTRGIGMKLMEKMGYKGGGLGKNEQGIAAPLEAKLRPKNMGMGFNDYQETKNLEEKQVKQPLAIKKEKVWKKSRRKNKDECITPEELLAKMQVHDAELKVVDMRGPQIRVLTNLENLNTEENEPVSELQHNIRLILDLVDLDILNLARKLRNEQDTALAIQREKAKLQKEAAFMKQQLDDLEEMENVLEELSEEESSGILTLESLAKSFEDLHSKYADDYKICNLSYIACSYAVPMLIREFQGWDPLQDPSYGRNLILAWRNLLQGEEYAQLVMEILLPAVRKSGINTWQARDPEPMLVFLEHWEDLLPFSVRQSILDMIVIPKLSQAVDSWDPSRETIPIHAWVHPWLPLLRDNSHLESLYQAIGIKLGLALQAWHPSDSCSAFAILDPWKTVFDSLIWETIIVRCILPKLNEVMEEFEVNPANQNLNQFKWVMNWASAIPIHHLVNLLELHFFKKWHKALHQWLKSNRDFEEVTQWYLGWKALLPPKLAANECIQIQLNRALSMTKQAFEGLQVAQPWVEQRQFDSEKKAASPTQMEESEMSLMEVISTYAEEHDLLFMPKPGRFHNNHQIHGFGKVSIIVDSVNQEIYAHAGEDWSLVYLEQLLQMQSVSGSKR